MALSTVVDGKGGTIPSAVRTSSGTFLPQAYDAVVRRVEKRVAFVTRLPAGAYPCSRGQDSSDMGYRTSHKPEDDRSFPATPRLPM